MPYRLCAVLHACERWCACVRDAHAWGCWLLWPQYLNNYHVSKRKEPTFDEHTVIAGFLKKHPDPYRQ